MLADCLLVPSLALHRFFFFFFFFYLSVFLFALQACRLSSLAAFSDWTLSRAYTGSAPGNKVQPAAHCCLPTFRCSARKNKTELSLSWLEWKTMQAQPMHTQKQQTPALSSSSKGPGFGSFSLFQIPNGELRLNHYTSKSVEEWNAKKARSNPPG